MKTMADWWDALPIAGRIEILRKRSLKPDVAVQNWLQLGWFVQGVLNDNRWWGFTQEMRPNLGEPQPVSDGPVDPEPANIK